MTAARVQILLDFFAVKTQQIGANIVDIVDIVAVLVKTVNQPGADLFPIRRLEIGFQHGHQLVKAETLLVEDHTLQGVQRIAQVSDSDTLNAGEVIARAASVISLPCCTQSSMNEESSGTGAQSRWPISQMLLPSTISLM